MESMLLEEARLASLIHHPNVVQTLELGEHDGALYLVMEWVDGEPLGYIMQQAEARGGIPLPIAVNFIGQTLLGLHAAHELTDDKGAPLGVVHRDVSPYNVLVTYAGVAKLVDFGIAKAMNQSVTHSGEIKGKISYMAPEQVRCAAVDRRADLFSIGIVLYLVTTRRHPFKGENSASTLHKITGDEPAVPPSQWIPGYPPALEAVVLKALEKTPERRFRSAEEMLDALRNALPEAFESNCQAQLKKFMSELLGKRATMRREALRRAQLAADSRAHAHATTAILGSNASPAQSGTSLRALAVDRPQAEVDELGPVQPSPERARAPRRVGLWLGLACLLALGGAALFVRAPHRSERSGASAGVDMVELTPSEPARAVPATSSSTSANAPETRESASVPAAPTSTAAGGSTHPHSVSAGSPADRRKSRRPTLKNSDLIAPDYAR
jgi:serine/threonine-protein kinase